MENNRTESIKGFLFGDFLGLIYDYDKDIYLKSENLKKALCDNDGIVIRFKSKIEDYLRKEVNHDEMGKTAQQRIRKNFRSINEEFCVD